MRPLLLILPIAVLAASPVMAARPAAPAASATVEWRHAPQKRVIVRDKVWSCREGECRGALDADRPRTRETMCRALARSAGKVMRFETASGPMNEPALRQCNDGLN